MKLVDKFKVGICVTGIIVTGSTQSIIIPLATLWFTSLYFIVLLTSLEFTVIFGIIYLILRKGKPGIPKEKMTIFLSGVFNAAMGICGIYSANPKRTPPVMQSVLNALGIIPSVIFTKYILKKKVRYILWLVIPSLILLLTSVGISSVPLFTTHTSHSHVKPVNGTKVDPHHPPNIPDAIPYVILTILWIGLYLFSIFSRSFYNIMQERYLIKTADGSLLNKITLVFYTRFIQLFLVLTFFWLEFIIGYDNNPTVEFHDSFMEFFTNWKHFLLLQGFIGAYMLLYIFSVYLNSISTNYNMVAIIIINPAVAIFFTVFSSLNPGIKYPWYIVGPSLVCSILSVILWIFGEKVQ